MNIEQKFKEHQENAIRKLAALRTAMEGLAAEHLARPGDWSVVGSAGHVVELLGEALKFLRGGVCCDHCGKGANTVLGDGEQQEMTRRRAKGETTWKR